jgi:sulfide:quinone oxidoreductase
MKTLLILGGGTGGTIVANKMAHLLDANEWRIVVVDRSQLHYYQPGFLFIPFGIYTPSDVVVSRQDLLSRRVEVVFSDIELIEPEASRVRLSSGQNLHYDELVIATGSQLNPDETPGLKGDGWYRNIFDFYTSQGASAIGRFLKNWPGGRLVVNVAEMPIKCPVAPLEFLFLADWYFTERHMRHKVDLVYATPLSGAFTKPLAAARLGKLLEHKGICIEPDFNLAEVDSSRQVIRSFDEREIGYDLLVTIPTNMGAEVIERSGMGDELRFVPTDKHTLQSKQWENVWVIGDATNVPTSKAGSVTHFESDILVDNIVRHTKGLLPLPGFDGHANCYIESGFGKGIMIDFNYEVEPLPGKYPLPGVGPFTLLEESSFNHWGKLSFRWIYWNILLKGHPLPIPSHMTMAGKEMAPQMN